MDPVDLRIKEGRIINDYEKAGLVMVQEKRFKEMTCPVKNMERVEQLLRSFLPKVHAPGCGLSSLSADERRLKINSVIQRQNIRAAMRNSARHLNLPGERMSERIFSSIRRKIRNSTRIKHEDVWHRVRIYV